MLFSRPIPFLPPLFFTLPFLSFLNPILHPTLHPPTLSPIFFPLPILSSYFPCKQAYIEGMTFGNSYVWLLFAWYQDNWWLDKPVSQSIYNPITCTTSELEEILERAILIDHFPFVPPENRSMTTDTGMVSWYIVLFRGLMFQYCLTPNRKVEGY